jgi:cholest-4-en-3-one 26-monooxygenase
VAVRWNPSPEGFWSITRHADIAFVSSHPELFSSLTAGVFLHKDQAVPLEINRNNLLYMDPPRTGRYSTRPSRRGP